MAVPYTFASATSAIPLSQLDANFATTITLGNTAIQLGNTVTTLNNMTLANATVSSGNVTVTSASLSGNLTFTGTGNRITGDFSNATVANRVAFQTSTTNGNTNIFVLPNGTGTIATHQYSNNSDITNASTFVVGVAGSGTEARLNSSIQGTGTYLPMTFYTGGSERMRIDTSGNVGIGTTAGVGRLTVLGGVAQFSPGTSANDGVRIQRETGYATFTGINNDNNAYNGIKFYTSGTASLQLDTTGNVVNINPNGGLGYGTGSGGTVTQATSKSTAVTLNKPTGQITMNNAALAAGASVIFRLNNSLISSTDCVLVQPSNAGSQAYATQAVFTSGGLVDIRVTNFSASSLSEALVVNFAIIKGATS